MLDSAFSRYEYVDQAALRDQLVAQLVTCVEAHRLKLAQLEANKQPLTPEHFNVLRAAIKLKAYLTDRKLVYPHFDGITQNLHFFIRDCLRKATESAQADIAQRLVRYAHSSFLLGDLSFVVDRSPELIDVIIAINDYFTMAGNFLDEPYLSHFKITLLETLDAQLGNIFFAPGVKVDLAGGRQLACDCENGVLTLFNRVPV